MLIMIIFIDNICTHKNVLKLKDKLFNVIPIVNTFVTEMSIMGPTSQVYTSRRVCTGTLGTPCRFAYG